jgi:hypothetical protein
VEVGQIAKRIVKNWWTKHGLPYYMQKIDKEIRVSSAALFLEVDKRISLSNCLFLTSPRLMKIPVAMVAMRVSRLPVMARKRKFLCEEPPLLGQLGVSPRWRQMCLWRLPRVMRPLLRRGECLRADLFFEWVVFCLEFK